MKWANLRREWSTIPSAAPAPREQLQSQSAVTLHRVAAFCFTARHCVPSYHFVIAVWSAKEAESAGVNRWQTTLAILATVLPSIVVAEDFKTINGKEYKNATVSRVEPDGVVLKSKSGIIKVYFTELPQDVQERFHWAKPNMPGEPFYGRWAAGAEDPAVMANIIAVATVVIAGVGLVIGYIRSRMQPITSARDRRSRRLRGKSLK